MSDLQTLRADPAAFRAALIIDVDGQPMRLADRMDDWQRADFEALDNGCRVAVGLPADPDKPIYQRAYLERPRGHSKTSDLATMVSWLLFSAGRKISGVAAAADRDQARLLRDSIDVLVRLNPWLQPFIDVQNYRVVNPHTGSQLQIISSDAATSYGLRPDFIVCDELTHWSREELWNSLFSSAAKRANCLLVAISNAGFGQGRSWQWKVREAFRTSDTVYFSRLNGPVASWITPDRLAEQERMLPPSAYGRLWLNLWTDESGDALDPADIKACCTQAGPIPGYIGEFAPFVGSLDLGLRNDHSALVVLGLDVPRQKLRLASCESWAPRDFASGQISLETVKAACLDAMKRFQLAGIVYDPWQAALLAEQLRSHGIDMIPSPFTGPSLNVMATTLLRVFRNRLIDLYPDEALLHDLQRLTIVEKTNGFRLDGVRDEMGHCDRGIALAMMLPPALRLLQRIDFCNQEPDETYAVIG